MRKDWTYSLAKVVLKPWLTVWFQWTIEGLENIPSEGAAILAINHIAYLDPFAAAFIVDRAHRRARFLAKSELFHDKRIGWVLKGADQIEVKRGTRDAPVALDQACTRPSAEASWWLSSRKGRLREIPI